MLCECRVIIGSQGIDLRLGTNLRTGPQTNTDFFRLSQFRFWTSVESDTSVSSVVNPLMLTAAKSSPTILMRSCRQKQN